MSLNMKPIKSFPALSIVYRGLLPQQIICRARNMSIFFTELSRNSLPGGLGGLGIPALAGPSGTLAQELLLIQCPSEV